MCVSVVVSRVFPAGPPWPRLRWAAAGLWAAGSSGPRRLAGFRLVASVDVSVV